MAHHALLIIDMQNAYFTNDSLRDQQQELISSCNRLIEAATSAQLPIFAVRTIQHRDISTWTLNMIEDKQGYLFKDTSEAMHVEGLDIDGVIEVIKTRDSAFFETPLRSMLRNYDITSLILAGVSTHTCVAQTAADAYAENFGVTIATDAVASHQPTYHQMTLDMFELEYRQKLQTVNEITSFLSNVE